MDALNSDETETPKRCEFT